MTPSPATLHSDAVLARLLALHPKRMDLTLDRIRRLLAALDDPQERLRNVVHVAGTNGKGSTIAMIRAGLEGAGCSVNVYTSPHLARFHERIRLRGELIEEAALSALLEECEAANSDEPITFFEITTAAAFLAMARAPADFTLLEVGLGGRLDATNVLTPRLTAIAPVSIDHQQYLGETLAEIAGEKAGILKPDVPCIVSPQAEAVLAVISARAAAVSAPLLVGGRDWTARAECGRLIYEDGCQDEDDEGDRLDLSLPALMGAHQVVNAGTALAVLRTLGAGDTEAAMTDAAWPARMQRLRRGALAERLPDGAELWLDGGHNAAAGTALADLLADMQRRSPAPLWLVVGMLEIKSALAYLRPFADLAEGLFAVPIPESDTAFRPEALARAAIEAGHAPTGTHPAASVAEALERILAAESNEQPVPPRILICGSLYLAGVVLRENG